MTEKNRNSKELSATAQKLLREIPKVDEFLKWLDENGQEISLQAKTAVREILEECREAILSSQLTAKKDLAPERLLALFNKRLQQRLEPNFRSVINATGVVVHTNLGRSVLPAEAMAWINRVGSGYSNLEFDLDTGKRGSRYSLVEELLCELTGAEAGLVVNNNAAAVLLCLDTLAKGREVIVSRGQLVEIGGSFRIPDVMTRSGASLVEVGATNRTHLRDYEGAITSETAMLLKVHTSNYRLIGFSSEVPLTEMVELAERYQLPVMEDLGSGSLLDLSRFGLMKEPTVGEVVKAGADVVTFSGDKLLGGPQAGIIVGKKKYIEKIQKNPMLRAMRIDKMTLAALEVTFMEYLDEERALQDIPVMRMLTEPVDTIKRRAKKILTALRKAAADKAVFEMLPDQSRAGGGSLPEADFPTYVVSIRPSEIVMFPVAGPG